LRVEGEFMLQGQGGRLYEVWFMQGLVRNNGAQGFEYEGAVEVHRACLLPSMILNVYNGRKMKGSRPGFGFVVYTV
jgi:hypothetical protein